MAEHHELVAEMAMLEQMGTQERQKLAKKRRMQQIKKWTQREKEWIAKEKQINKRLANTLNEENNGLNLKCYTYFSSSTSKTNNNNNNIINSNENNNNKKNTKKKKPHFSNLATNNISSKLNSYVAQVSCRERVNFEPGVMLLEAAARNDTDEVKRLFALGVSPDSVNHDGLTALHQCCIDASEPMMSLLLEFGANVDARDMEHWTPLHAACTCGHLNLVKRLVENGADLLSVNGDGNLPFDICEDEATLDYIESEMVKQGITQELIDKTRTSIETQMLNDIEQKLVSGEDLDARFEYGVTFLHVAAANGYTNATSLLIKHGVNVNACDNDRWTSLHGAACWGTMQHTKIVEMLVEAGADLNAKTINDETVIDLCDNPELLERLNQLKDELENNEANNLNKLRRTQSKTHSRIHSVRRTSIREKNLISRREARQEAMLRVDSTSQPQLSSAQVADTKNNNNVGNQMNLSSINSTTKKDQSQAKVDKNSDLKSSEEADSSCKESNNNDIISNSSSNNNRQQVGSMDKISFKAEVKVNSIESSQRHIVDRLANLDITNLNQLNGGMSYALSESNLKKATTTKITNAAAPKVELKSANAQQNLKADNGKSNDQSNGPSGSMDEQKINGRSTSLSDNSANSNCDRNRLSMESNNCNANQANSNSKSVVASAQVESSVNKSCTNGAQNRQKAITAVLSYEGHLQQQALSFQDKGGPAAITNKPLICNSKDNCKARGGLERSGSSCVAAGSASDLFQQAVPAVETYDLKYSAPVNLTLANLKKQRSDLRNNRLTAPITAPTTATPIPAPTITGATIATVDRITTKSSIINGVAINSGNLKVLNNGKSHCLAETSSSPESTLRKFRGDPRDVIGGNDERNTRRKCCILI